MLVQHRFKPYPGTVCSGGLSFLVVEMITRLLILLVLRLVGYVYEAMLVGTATYLSLLVLRVGIGCLYNYINLLVGMT